MSTTKRLVMALAISMLLLASLAMLTEAAMHLRQGRQSSSSSSTALAPGRPVSTITALQNVIYPAMQSIIAAPLRMLQELLRELRAFFRAHNWRELYDMTVLREALQKLPGRISTYWATFTEMEYECIRRTACDLADFTSHQLPSWANQILLVYFSAYQDSNAYYHAVTQGLVSHNCPILFNKCEPKSFLERISSNMTNTFDHTVAPLREAFAAVTASTLNALDPHDSSDASSPDDLIEAPLEGEASHRPARVFTHDQPSMFARDNRPLPMRRNDQL